MRVLFVSHQAGFVYGGEVVTIEMIRGLREAGIETEFASPAGPYQDLVKAVAPVHGIPSVEFRRSWSTLPATLLSVARTAWRLLRLKRGFTHLHAQSLKAHVYCWLPGLLSGIPVIWHHHDIMPHTRANSLWLRVLALGARRIVVPSSAARDALVAAGVADGKIAVVRNGFPVERWRVRTGRSAGLFRVIFVGEISQRKGADLLPRISDLLGDGFLIRVAGEGLSDPSFAHEVQRSAQGAVASGRMEFLGRRNDVPALLQEADAILVPSREDPLPTVVIEASLSGVPCVGAPVGGMPELVENGVTGFLVDGAEAMAEKLRHLARHPEERVKMGLAARALAEERFSIRRVVRELTTVYSGT